MNEQENRRLVERYFQALRSNDVNAMSAILHDDYVEEMPQSGEQIRGKQNWSEMMQAYPGLPTPSNERFQVFGDTGIGEVLLQYPNGEKYWSCSLFEFKDGKVYRTREYFGQPFEAPQWRAKWAEKREERKAA